MNGVPINPRYEPPARACPPWCDRRHDIDDQVAFFHSRAVAELGGASVVLPSVQYRDRRRGLEPPVILVNAQGQRHPTHLLAAEAAAMITALEAAGCGLDWLARALRTALTLLET